MGEKQRSAYWDNYKTILIFFVVLGHFLMSVPDKGRIIQVSTEWIYLFHMPAFVFVSGVFSKSYVKKEKKELKLIGFLAIYVLFVAIVTAVSILLNQNLSLEAVLKPFFVQNGAPWYMLAMFFWYAFIPYMSRIKPAVAFTLIILVALVIGRFSQFGDFLALSRTIVFFPFFLAGYYCKYDTILSKSIIARAAGFAFLIGSAVVLLYFDSSLTDVLRLRFASSSYSVQEMSFSKGMLMRLLWYAWSSCMMVSFMCVIPRKRMFFSYIGERTLGIYVLHRIIRDVFAHYNGYALFGNDLVLLIACMVIAAIVVFITSIKPVSSLLRKMMQMDFFSKDVHC
ncbi:MAG: acyltransferase family protein [Clostridiales bacterium]|nr:acyltransferase family protein [Clostridiales bacterium]